MEKALIVSTMLGIISSVIVGLLNTVSETIDAWPGLAKQLLVLGVAIIVVVVVNFFNIGNLPQEYQTPMSTVLQALVATLTGIGAHGVKTETKKMGDS